MRIYVLMFIRLKSFYNKALERKYALNNGIKMSKFIISDIYQILYLTTYRFISCMTTYRETPKSILRSNILLGIHII